MPGRAIRWTVVTLSPNEAALFPVLFPAVGCLYSTLPNAHASFASFAVFRSRRPTPDAASASPDTSLVAGCSSADSGSWKVTLARPVPSRH